MKNTSVLLVTAFFLVSTLFAQAQTGYKRTVTVEFSDSPMDQVNIAPLKYNKKMAYSLTIDDGHADIWNVAYPLISGQPVTETSINSGINYGSGSPYQKVGGFNFDDGCGNQVPFKLGLAVNGSFINMNSSFLEWPQLKTIYQAGWDILNHSYTHDFTDPIDFQTEIQYNADFIHDQLAAQDNTIDFYPRHFAIPTNVPLYVPETANYGMVATYGAISGFIGEYNGGYWAIDGDISAVNNHLQFMRTPVPTSNVNIDAIKNKFDQLAATATNHPLWYNEYTHAMRADDSGGPNMPAVPGNSNLGFGLFKDYMEYIENTYSDIVWIAGIQEVEEYLFIRENAAITNKALTGNTLTFDVELDMAQPDQRNFGLSILVGTNIASVSIDGDAEGLTWNPETGLINFELTPQPIQSGNSYTILSGTTVTLDQATMPGPYDLITIENGAFLKIPQGIEARFKTEGEIRIMPNGKLELHGTLTADNQHWKGIRIYGNDNSASITGFQTALIEKADIAIETKTFDRDYANSVINFNGVTFRNNRLGVELSFGAHDAVFQDCLFENTDEYNQPKHFDSFVRLYMMKGAQFLGCRFVDNQATQASKGWGVATYEAKFKVDSYYNQNSHFEGLKVAIIKHDVFTGQPYSVEHTDYISCGQDLLEY